MNMFITIRSTVDIQAAPERVWRLLGDARLPEPPCALARRLLPVPLACRVSDDGRRRECRTSRGTIRQRITASMPGRVLAFEMVSQEAGLGWLVLGMRDRFDVERVGDVTRLTRTSVLRPRCGAAAWVLRAAVPRVHRYVHARFKRLAEDVSGPPAGRPAGA
jgi:hypothetical protein